MTPCIQKPSVCRCLLVRCCRERHPCPWAACSPDFAKLVSAILSPCDPTGLHQPWPCLSALFLYSFSFGRIFSFLSFFDRGAYYFYRHACLSLYDLHQLKANGTWSHFCDVNNGHGNDFRNNSVNHDAACGGNRETWKVPRSEGSLLQGQLCLGLHTPCPGVFYHPGKTRFILKNFP